MEWACICAGNGLVVLLVVVGGLGGVGVVVGAVGVGAVVGLGGVGVVGGGVGVAVIVVVGGVGGGGVTITATCFSIPLHACT